MNRHTYYNRFIRDKEAKQFYNSKAWEVCRTNALIRDHYLCQECLKDKTIRIYDVVHHIKPRRDYPKLALTVRNLVSLCHACHNRIENELSNSEENKKRRVNVVEFGANPEIM